MAASKMTILAATMALLGVFAPGVLSVAPLSDSTYTETVAGQEIGSTTSDGFIVYSMNHCTVVQSTTCEVMLHTGGAAPSSATVGLSSSAADAEETAYPPGETITSASVPYNTVPEAGSSTEHEHWPAPTESAGITATEVSTSVVTDASSASDDISPTTSDSSASSTSSGGGAESSGAAADSLDALHGAAIGAVGMVAAYLF